MIKRGISYFKVSNAKGHTDNEIVKGGEKWIQNI